MNGEVKKAVKTLLSASLPKEKWTNCHTFRCVMNTGWAAGKDKYKCRIGKDWNSCGAEKHSRKDWYGTDKARQETYTGEGA